MKKGWVTKKLSEVTTKIGSGATPRGGNESYKSEGISLIRSLNVYDDGFREAKLARIDDRQADALSNVVVEPHDVLLNITGASVARCCRAPAHHLPARVNQHVSIIRPIQSKLDSDFLHYMLISAIYKDRLLHTGNEGGSTRQAITKAQIQEFIIRFPESLPEQRRIVGVLDEAFAAIATAKANTEKNLQNAQAIFESYLQTTFSLLLSSVPNQPLAEIADFKNGLNFNTNSSGNKVRCAGVGDFQNSYLLNEDDLGSVTIDGELNASYELKENDILVVRSNGSKHLVGRSLLVSEISSRVSFSGFVIRIRFTSNDIHAKYMLYFFKSRSTRDLLTKDGGGSNITNINQKKLSLLSVPTPSPKEQVLQTEKFDALLSETQRLTSLYSQKLTTLDALKQSLLHQAFSGNL